jgi:CRP-like cAMP-binding protein
MWFFNRISLLALLSKDEMRLAHHLMLGQVGTSNKALQTSLDYELLRVQQRLFGLLLQLYPPQIIADAQRGVAHATRERQANALEMLDNLIPRPVYQGLQAILDVVPAAEKVRRFDALLGSSGAAMPIVPAIIERGEQAYTDWTISRALGQWHPTPYTVALVLPHLHSANQLVQQSAVAVLDQFAHAAPEDFQQLLAAHPHLVSLLMSHQSTTSHISATERVALLKNTALFSETPENVLSSIVPIKKEVSFLEGEQIFAKGDLGTSLFIVQEGEVNIFSGTQQLATFRPGDFFGELALLDAEPRSASAVAHGAVVAFRLDQEDFYDVMEERGEVLRNILRVLCQRLRRQNEKMHVPEVK